MASLPASTELKAGAEVMPASTVAAAPMVLSYATGETMPTRVRFNTAELVGRWALGILMMGILVLDVEVFVLAYCCVTECFHGWDDLFFTIFNMRGLYLLDYWGASARPFADMFQEYLQANWPYTAGCLVLLGDGILLRWLAVMVRRGSRGAAMLAIFMLSPIALALLGLTMAALYWGIYFTLTAGGASFWFLMLVPVGVGILIMTLMVGVFRQLAWVVRNPELERPPLYFWPRRWGAGR